jgi:hypothetical protein
MAVTEQCGTGRVEEEAAWLRFHRQTMRGPSGAIAMAALDETPSCETAQQNGVARGIGIAGRRFVLDMVAYGGPDADRGIITEIPPVEAFFLDKPV